MRWPGLRQDRDIARGDEPGNYSSPAGPNGALTAITYSYAGRPCVDRGNLRPASCGLSEVPPPPPAELPIVHEPLRTHLQIRNHVIASAQISFRAPYPVTNADESYSVSAPVCYRGLAGEGSRAGLARGALVTIPVGWVLSQACSRAVRFTVEYVRFAGGLPRPTPLGSVTIHEPPGTHPVPLPRGVVEQERRAHPTRSLHATVHLTLLPQPRAACNAGVPALPVLQAGSRRTCRKHQAGQGRVTDLNQRERKRHGQARRATPSTCGSDGRNGAGL
jgi:hypothetical protein